MSDSGTGSLDDVKNERHFPQQNTRVDMRDNLGFVNPF